MLGRLSDQVAPIEGGSPGGHPSRRAPVSAAYGREGEEEEGREGRGRVHRRRESRRAPVKEGARRAAYGGKGRQEERAGEGGRGGALRHPTRIIR